MSKLDDRFGQFLKEWGIENQFVREHRFHPERRWRFDYANVEKKIAVECEGGAFIGGRHTFGATFVADTEKYNMATAMGWRVFRFARVGDMKEFINLYAELLHVDSIGTKQEELQL